MDHKLLPLHRHRIKETMVSARNSVNSIEHLEIQLSNLKNYLRGVLGGSQQLLKDVDSLIRADKERNVCKDVVLPITDKHWKIIPYEPNKPKEDDHGV